MFTCDPEKFVNRVKELAFIREEFSRLAKGDPFAAHERVVHFIGPSGIGKSCLLEQCYELASAIEPCIPILIRFDELKEMSGDLVGSFLVKVDKSFSDYLKIPVQTKSGKTSSRYGSELIRKINKQAANRVVILFLDEINILHKEELQGIEEHLLERFIEGRSQAMLVTAGRKPPDLNVFPLRSSQKNTSTLAPFEEKTTGEQVEKLRSGSAHLAEKIQGLGGGVPGKNKRLLEQAVGDPLSIPDELQALQTLLADVKSEIPERFHPVIEAISVLQTIFPDDAVPLLECHPTLGDQWDEAKTKEIFTDLNRIQVGPGGLMNWDKTTRSWVVDESTRTLFERELQMRDPELWRKLHCKAYAMYKKWAGELKSPVYKEKSNYHKQCLQVAQMDCDDLEKEG